MIHCTQMRNVCIDVSFALKMPVSLLSFLSALSVFWLFTLSFCFFVALSLYSPWCDLHSWVGGRMQLLAYLPLWLHVAPALSSFMQQTADFVTATNRGRDHNMALKSNGEVPETEFLDLWKHSFTIVLRKQSIFTDVQTCLSLTLNKNCILMELMLWRSEKPCPSLYRSGWRLRPQELCAPMAALCSVTTGRRNHCWRSTSCRCPSLSASPWLETTGLSSPTCCRCRAGAAVFWARSCCLTLGSRSRSSPCSQSVSGSSCSSQRRPQSEVFFCDSGVDINNRPMGRMIHMLSTSSTVWGVFCDSGVGISNRPVGGDVTHVVVVIRSLRCFLVIVGWRK